jgi:hypothetical protein
MKLEQNAGNNPSESEFRAHVVHLIIDGDAEGALELLAKYYKVSPPGLRVGLPKGRRKGVSGLYTGGDHTIHVLNSDVLRQPFIIIHEFYHHLRTATAERHKGTEHHADAFARGFMESYSSMTGNAGT